MNLLIADMFPAPTWSPLGNMPNSLPNAWSTGAGTSNMPCKLVIRIC